MRFCTFACYTLFAWGVLGSPALADDDHTLADRFDLHGYLTLGWADLDLDDPRPTNGDETILGIPEDGALYGNAALLARYTHSRQHSFILQLSARELGDSPVGDLEDEVELDWLFYQYQPRESWRIRLGRVPVAVGIFNEIRDVGVLLPFYRPSFVFYREGSIFSETVDGISISHSFARDRTWSFDLDAYYGKFEVIEQGVGLTERVTTVDAKDAIGVQLWANTPVDGLRLGVGAQRWKVGAESRFNFRETTWKSWYLSFDWMRENFVVRAEYRRLESPSQSSPQSSLTEAELDIAYLQLGWQVTERLGFWIQPEIMDITQNNDVFVGGSVDFRDRQDIGISAVYRFRSNLVLKAEYHEVENELVVSQVPVPVPGGFLLDRTYGGFDSSYSIISLSTSF